jgi:hypothetical protein
VDAGWLQALRKSEEIAVAFACQPKHTAMDDAPVHTSSFAAAAYYPVTYAVVQHGHVCKFATTLSCYAPMNLNAPTSICFSSATADSEMLLDHLCTFDSW